MDKEKRLIELGNALRMIQNSKEDCPETSVKGRAIWETAHNCALSCLTNCDTVQAVEVVHGRWKQMEFWPGGGTWRCSECGNQFMFLKDTPTTKEMNYCHKCGAKMDGGNEDG